MSPLRPAPLAARDGDPPSVGSTPPLSSSSSVSFSMAEWLALSLPCAHPDAYRPSPATLAQSSSPPGVALATTAPPARRSLPIARSPLFIAAQTRDPPHRSGSPMIVASIFSSRPRTSSSPSLSSPAATQSFARATLSFTSRSPSRSPPTSFPTRLLRVVDPWQPA